MTTMQLAWLIVLCAKAAIKTTIDCALVVTSGGKDLEAMQRAYAALDTVSELEDFIQRQREEEQVGEAD